MSSLGQTLRAAREEKGLTLEDVAEAIRIRVHLLKALEDEQYSAFPSSVITRGMIRNYAKSLGLDPIEALTMFDGHGVLPVKGQRQTPEGAEFMDFSMTPRPFPWELIIIAVLMISMLSGGAYVAYNWFSELGEMVVIAQPEDVFVAISTPTLDIDQAFILDTPTPLPTNTPTIEPPTPTPTAVVYTGVTVELIIREESWVQISVDNVKAFEGIMQTGDSRQWTGEKRVAIRAGNGGGVEVIANGINRGLMGPQGQVVDQVWEKVEDAAVPPIQPTEPPLATETPTPLAE